jgi:hypothetical protein
VTVIVHFDDRFASLFKGKLSETDTFLYGLRSTAERQNPRLLRREASQKFTPRRHLFILRYFGTFF